MSERQATAKQRRKLHALLSENLLRHEDDGPIDVWAQTVAEASRLIELGEIRRAQGDGMGFNTNTPGSVRIDVPVLEHFQFKHGRDVVRRRYVMLDRVDSEIRAALDWLKRERRYLHDNCLGHVYPHDERDPGGGGGFCKDCGKENPTR